MNPVATRQTHDAPRNAGEGEAPLPSQPNDGKACRPRRRGNPAVRKNVSPAVRASARLLPKKMMDLFGVTQVGVGVLAALLAPVIAPG